MKHGVSFPAPQTYFMTQGTLLAIGKRGVRLSSPSFLFLFLFFFLTAGSGQQSVTGVTSVDDSNSYWRIRGKTATVCERGTPIRCGQPIRLTHVNTGRNLHSHHFTSPLSGNQVRWHPVGHCCSLLS